MKNLINYFKQLLEMPVEYWENANEYMKLRRSKIRLKRACKVADIKTSMDGRRRWVINDWNNNPVDLTRYEIKKLQSRGIMGKKITFLDLDRESLYHTKTNSKKFTTKRDIV